MFFKGSDNDSNVRIPMITLTRERRSINFRDALFFGALLSIPYERPSKPPTYTCTYICLLG